MDKIEITHNFKAIIKPEPHSTKLHLNSAITGKISFKSCVSLCVNDIFLPSVFFKTEKKNPGNESDDPGSGAESLLLIR